MSKQEVQSKYGFKEPELAFEKNTCITLHTLCAQMAELADALDSKSGSFGSVGSTPTLGTIFKPLLRKGLFLAHRQLAESERIESPRSSENDSRAWRVVLVLFLNHGSAR